MRKFSIVVVLLLLIVLVGCGNKVKFTVVDFDEKIGLNQPYPDSSFEGKCVLITQYEDFILFLNQGIFYYKDEYIQKYDSNYFIDNALIIYYGTDGTPYYKYRFDLRVEDETLILNIYYSWPKGEVPDVEVIRVIFIEIKNDVLNEVNGFSYTRTRK